MDQGLNQAIKSLDPSQQEALEPSHPYALCLHFHCSLDLCGGGPVPPTWVRGYICLLKKDEFSLPHNFLEIV